jgi:hypothetical protein
MPTQQKKPRRLSHPAPPSPLRLCEASGPCGWLQRYVAPDQRLPSYTQLKLRTYDGFYPSFLDGGFRCIDERNVPDLLAAFALVPAEVAAVAA